MNIERVKMKTIAELLFHYNIGHSHGLKKTNYKCVLFMVNI